VFVSRVSLLPDAGRDDRPLALELAATRATPSVLRALAAVLATHARPGGLAVHLRLRSPRGLVVTALPDSLRVGATPALFGDLRSLLGPSAVAPA
jgi:DNA polymerase-3 subunit alpha